MTRAKETPASDQTEAAEVEALAAELSSTKDALAFAVESVEKMREQLTRGVGICSSGTCRQPALALIGGWPLCGEHGEERARADRGAAEARGAERALAAVEALIGPDEVFPNWSKYPHMYRVTAKRRDLGAEVTSTVVDERALRNAIAAARAAATGGGS